jgi:hypothetical protein
MVLHLSFVFVVFTVIYEEELSKNNQDSVACGKNG